MFLMRCVVFNWFIEENGLFLSFKIFVFEDFVWFFCVIGYEIWDKDGFMRFEGIIYI